MPDSSEPLVLWVVPVAGLGGVARHALDVARVGVPGYRVWFLVPPGPLADELRALGAAVLTGHLGPDAGTKASIDTVRWTVRTLRPAIVHTHLAHADVVAAIATLGLPVQLVSTEHGIAGDDLVYHHNPARQRLMAIVHAVRTRRFHALIAVSEATAKAMRQKWGAHAVSVIRNGADRDRAGQVAPASLGGSQPPSTGSGTDTPTGPGTDESTSPPTDPSTSSGTDTPTGPSTDPSTSSGTDTPTGPSTDPSTSSGTEESTGSRTRESTSPPTGSPGHTDASPGPRRSGGVAVGRLRVASLARLSPEKGLEALLDAFALVRERHPGATLTIAGDGPLRDTLIARAARLGLGESVRFPGYVEGPALLAQTDVLAQLSVWENCSYALLDALVAGVGVCATPVGGNPEILPKRCLVGSSDPAAVAAVIEAQSAPDARPALPTGWPTVADMTRGIAATYDQVRR